LSPAYLTYPFEIENDYNSHVVTLQFPLASSDVSPLAVRV